MIAKFDRLALSLFSVLLFWIGRCDAQPPKLEDIRVSVASFGVIYYPHFIAKELNFYQEEGLNIEIIAMPGGLATQALVAGDLQFSTSSGSSLNASLRGKSIGVASRGDTMEGAANLLLRKYGMDPARDVTWIALGTPGRVPS